MSQISLEEIVVGAAASQPNSHTVFPNIVPVPRGSVELTRNQTLEDFKATEAAKSSTRKASGSPRDAQVRLSSNEIAEVTAAGVGLSHRISVEIQSRTSNQIRQSIDQRQHKLEQHVTSVSASRSPVQARNELKELRAAKKVSDIVAHTYSFSELTTILNTDLLNGLSVQDSKSRLLRDGHNRLTPPKQIPWWVKLIKQLVGGFQLMLIGAAVLCWVVGNLSNPIDQQTNFLGYVLIVVVVVTGIFAFFQEAKSDKVMEVCFCIVDVAAKLLFSFICQGFKALTPSHCHVVRDGSTWPFNSRSVWHSLFRNRHRMPRWRSRGWWHRFHSIWWKSSCRFAYHPVFQSEGSHVFISQASSSVFTLCFRWIIQVWLENQSHCLAQLTRPAIILWRRRTSHFTVVPFTPWTITLCYLNLICHSGTFFTEGSGKGVVFQTGDRCKPFQVVCLQLKRMTYQNLPGLHCICNHQRSAAGTVFCFISKHRTRHCACSISLSFRNLWFPLLCTAILFFSESPGFSKCFIQESTLQRELHFFVKSMAGQCQHLQILSFVFPSYLLAGLAIIQGIVFFLIAVFGIKWNSLSRVVFGFPLLLTAMRQIVCKICSRYPMLQALIFSIGLITANVPEGLLPQLTIILTLAARRMKVYGISLF